MQIQALWRRPLLWSCLVCYADALSVDNVYQWHQCRRPRLYINWAKMMAGREENIKELSNERYFNRDKQSRLIKLSLSWLWTSFLLILRRQYSRKKKLHNSPISQIRFFLIRAWWGCWIESAGIKPTQGRAGGCWWCWGALNHFAPLPVPVGNITVQSREHKAECWIRHSYSKTIISHLKSEALNQFELHTHWHHLLKYETNFILWNATMV